MSNWDEKNGYTGPLNDNLRRRYVEGDWSDIEQEIGLPPVPLDYVQLPPPRPRPSFGKGFVIGAALMVGFYAGLVLVAVWLSR